MRVWYVFVHEIQNRVHGDRRHDGDGGGVWRGRSVLGAARDGWGRLDARRHDGGSGDTGLGTSEGGSSGATSDDGSPPAGDDAGLASDSGGEVPPPPALTWKLESNLGGLSGIWGSGPNDIYVVGSSGFLQHSTGDGKWDIEDPGTGANLYGVWGSGPTDVYIAPYINTILHSTGDGGWEHEPQAAGTTFQGIWGSGPNRRLRLLGGAIHSDGGGVWQTPSSGHRQERLPGRADPGDVGKLVDRRLCGRRRDGRLPLDGRRHLGQGVHAGAGSPAGRVGLERHGRLRHRAHDRVPLDGRKELGAAGGAAG